jgi:hypothetical protein
LDLFVSQLVDVTNQTNSSSSTSNRSRPCLVQDNSHSPKKSQTERRVRSRCCVSPLLTREDDSSHSRLEQKRNALFGSKHCLADSDTEDEDFDSDDEKTVVCSNRQIILESRWESMPEASFRSSSSSSSSSYSFQTRRRNSCRNSRLACREDFPDSGTLILKQLYEDSSPRRSCDFWTPIVAPPSPPRRQASMTGSDLFQSPEEKDDAVLADQAAKLSKSSAPRLPHRKSSLLC